MVAQKQEKNLEEIGDLRWLRIWVDRGVRWTDDQYRSRRPINQFREADVDPSVAGVGYSAAGLI